MRDRFWVLVLVLLAIFMLTLLPKPAVASELDNDCYNYMAGSKRFGGVDDKYGTYDSAGVKEACRNKFKTWGERFIFKRDKDSPDTTYTVTRSYCWARNAFRGNACSWPTGPAWGDDYSAIFLPSDIKSPEDGDGRKILRKGGYRIVVKKNSTTGKPIRNKSGEEEIEVVGSGIWGDHVCLKRFLPHSAILSSGNNVKVNLGKRNVICAYLVNALVNNACTAPVGDWDKALIGCIEEPLNAGPPSYNPVIAADIAPYVDPDTSLEQYIGDYKSTFQQPVIKLLNGKASDGPLLLRYKFPGDNTVVDTLKASGSFPSDKNRKVYRAVVDLNDPSKICACEGADCDDRLYIGCAPRPTPRDSHLKVVAEYAVGKDKAPAVRPVFVETGADGEIIYYDADKSPAKKNAAGDAFKLDKNGNITGTAAALPLTYKKLPLPHDDFAIREYYLDKDAKIYNRDVMTVYGVTFQAIIPHMISDTVPAFVILDTRSETCNALKIADDQGDETKPNYFIPAGDRDRAYCNCPPGNPQNCPIPKVQGCNGMEHEEDAMRIYCPGALKMPSQVDKSNMICLQPASSWNFSSYEYDKMCVQIPTDCAAEPDPSISYGISAWPKLTQGAVINGSCDMQTGIEPFIRYQWNPPALIERQNFDCSKITGNCDYTYYNLYKIQFYRALKTLNSVQALAHSLNRNLNENDKRIINKSMGDFSSFHTLKADQATEPQRSCNLTKDTGLVTGLIKSPCMIQNSCEELKHPAYITGYATWDKVRDLNGEENNKVNSLPFADIYIKMKGKCPVGYRESKEGSPVRECYSKYVNHEKVGGRWLEVTNPCVKLTPEELNAATKAASTGSTTTKTPTEVKPGVTNTAPVEPPKPGTTTTPPAGSKPGTANNTLTIPPLNAPAGVPIVKP